MLKKFLNKFLLCFLSCVFGSLHLNAQDEKNANSFNLAFGANTSSYIINTDENVPIRASISPVFLGGNASISYQLNSNKALHYLFEARYSFLGFRSDRYIPTHAVITTPQSPIFRDIYSFHQVGAGIGFSYGAFREKKFSITCKSSALATLALKNEFIRKTYQSGSNDAFFSVKDINASEDAKNFNLLLSTRLHFDNFTFLKNHVVPYIGISYHILNYTTSEFINGGFANSNTPLDGKMVTLSLGISYQ